MNRPQSLTFDFPIRRVFQPCFFISALSSQTMALVRASISRKAYGDAIARARLHVRVDMPPTSRSEIIPRP